MKVEMMGLMPESKGKDHTYPVFHCEKCHAPIVWAWDDLYPDSTSRIYRRKIDFDPVMRGTGQVILWYQVDDEGHPVGRQFFRRASEQKDYRGHEWDFHATTCAGRETAHARTP